LFSLYRSFTIRTRCCRFAYKELKVEISLLDQPLLINGQYTEAIGDYRFYYNPKGWGGVTVVDRPAIDLLQLCDGKHTVADILKLSGRPETEVLAELSALTMSQVIYISAEMTKAAIAAKRTKRSLQCWLHLTNSCNLACDYCYIRKSPGLMPLATGKLAIDKMRQSCQRHGIHKMVLKFAGGEPLLRFNVIKDLVDYADTGSEDINVMFTVLTNGVLVTPEIAKYFSEHQFGVGVSLDGIGKYNDIHRHTAKGLGSYHKVIAGLDLLRDAGITPAIMVTLTSDNIGNLEAITEFIVSNGYRFRFSLERDTDTGQPNLLQKIPETIAALNRSYDLYESLAPMDDVTQTHKFVDTTYLIPTERSCGAAVNYFAVGHDGRLGSCQMGLVQPYGSLFDDGDILDLTHQANADLVNRRSSTFEGCKDCVWRNCCAGGCPMQTKSSYGRLDKASPYCEVYKQILPKILRIKARQMIRCFEATNPLRLVNSLSRR